MSFDKFRMSVRLSEKKIVRFGHPSICALFFGSDVRPIGREKNLFHSNERTENLWSVDASTHK